MARTPPEEPTGPPPAWLDDFERDLREALKSQPGDKDGPPFDPPDGVSIFDQPPGHIQATFLKKPPHDRT